MKQNTFLASVGNEKDFAERLRRFGIRKDPPDRRRWHAPARLAEYPSVVRNDHLIGRVLDQGKEGSCGGHTQCKASTVLKTALGAVMPPQEFSPRWAYDVAKVADDREGLEKQDYLTQEGTTLAALCWGAHRLGALPERLWPYEVQEKEAKSLPEFMDLGKQAKPHRISAYYDLTRGRHAATPEEVLLNIKAAVAETGCACLGIAISYDWIDTGPDGVINEGQIISGGHAVLCCGYDDTRKMLRILNSWGTAWGDKGFGWYKYEYLERRLMGAYRQVMAKAA